MFSGRKLRWPTRPLLLHRDPFEPGVGVACLGAGADHSKAVTEDGIYHSLVGDAGRADFFWGDCAGIFKTPVEREVIQFAAGIFHSIAMTKWKYLRVGIQPEQLGLSLDPSTRYPRAGSTLAPWLDKKLGMPKRLYEMLSLDQSGLVRGIFFA